MDLTDYKNVKNLLKSFRVWTKKRLGQHFLVDRQTLDKIIKTAKIKKNEYITEIGPGHGVLTLELLKNGAKVDAVEIDSEILPLLNYVTDKYKSQLEIYNQHILGYEQKNFPYKLVANIPYHLSSPILRKFFVETDNLPTKAVLLMQKEVAEKICNTKKKSILALFVQVFGRAEIVQIVSENSFLPPPKVKSAILKIEIFDKPKINIDKKMFFKMIKIGFASPRKMLKNVLDAYNKSSGSKFATATDTFEKLHIPFDVRAENLEIEDWENLAKEFFSLS